MRQFVARGAMLGGALLARDEVRDGLAGPLRDQLQRAHRRPHLAGLDEMHSGARDLAARHLGQAQPLLDASLANCVRPDGDPLLFPIDASGGAGHAVQYKPCPAPPPAASAHGSPWIHAACAPATRLQTTATATTN